jgi:nitroreductase
MDTLLDVIRRRHSSRGPFDKKRRPSEKDIGRILEAARWTPTAHNMQNFEIIVVDDKRILGHLGNIKYKTSEAFIRENCALLSRSEGDLRSKKVGILGNGFPPEWRNPKADFAKLAKESSSLLKYRIQGSPVLMILIYDPNKRAPASEGDSLGFMSIGCAMENMWLTAESLGIGFHVISSFGNAEVEMEARRILAIPKSMKIAFAIRLGYPIPSKWKYPRIRRNVADFIHRNRFGNKSLRTEK